MNARIALACLSLCAAVGGAQQAIAGAPVVMTSNGRIEGLALKAGGQAFLGVPYAAAPVRDLRWRDPAPVPAGQGVYHADRFAPQCVQPQRNLCGNQYSGAEVTSEDCLYLNIWTRADLKKAPVIVFIHGGGFYIGSSSMGIYGGDAVSREGAVFVNFNYRLGALGFLAHPELSKESPHHSSGNYAFLDQIAALQWVKRNIAKFGGDPDNVTIAGQSAGSMAVQTLAASPLAQGLFHKIVGMSGAMVGGPSAMLALGEAEQEGVKLQNVLRAKNLAELRSLPADRIVVPRNPDAPKIGPLLDGYVVPAEPGRNLAQSVKPNLPTLLGFTRDESFGGFGPIKDLADNQARAATRFGGRGAEFLALYPASNDDEARAQARLADRDSTMALGMSQWANAQSAQGRSPVYSYEFARSHSYAPGVNFSDLDPATAGAYHTSEVPFWLGTLDAFNRFRVTRAWKTQDYAFSQAMTRSLVAFARSGKPDTKAMAWPRYAQGQPRLLRLGDAAQVQPWPEARRLEFFRSHSAAQASGGALRD